jgi:hypothetical protein
MTNIKQIDYSNTIFYKIQCKDLSVTDLYIGHTTDFVKRKSTHKSSCYNKNNMAYSSKVYKVIRNNNGWDNWNMEIISFRNCDGLASAKKIEQQYFEEYKATMNSIEPSPKPKTKCMTETKTYNNRMKYTCVITNNIKRFVCDDCHFSCYKKGDYARHIMTAKHKLLVNENANVANEKNRVNNYRRECKCGKIYKHSASLSRHKLTCNATGNINNDDPQTASGNIDPSNNPKESLIPALITQNKELMNLLTSQQQETKCLLETIKEQSATIQEQSATMQQTIKDIIPKIGNNNNNTTNNNKFNLQVFLNEDCKDAINFSEFIENMQVTVEDLENQAQLGYVGGISKLFLENMKELGVNKRPLHCTDKKRNTIYIKENNEWDKEGSQEQLLHGIKVITGRANQTLCDMKEDNPIEYSDIDSPFSTRCEDIQRSLLPGYPRETTLGKVIDSISISSTIER